MDSNEIKKVLQTYFDACNENCGDKMDSILHNAAHVYGHAEGGTLNDMDKEFFVDLIRSEQPAEDFPRADEILSIDFTGENTAIARVKLRVGNTLYTDILSLIRLEGKWMIISKLYSGQTV